MSFQWRPPFRHQELQIIHQLLAVIVRMAELVRIDAGRIYGIEAGDDDEFRAGFAQSNEFVQSLRGF
jgi:hypothetical protein